MPYLKYDLQLFAKEGSGGEKTEEPTAKKLKDARNKGQVAKSRFDWSYFAAGVFCCFKNLCRKPWESFYGNNP